MKYSITGKENITFNNNAFYCVGTGRMGLALQKQYYEQLKFVQEKLGFVYHHTCDDVPVPLLNEVRIGHTNVMTKEQWYL